MKGKERERYRVARMPWSGYSAIDGRIELVPKLARRRDGSSESRRSKKEMKLFTKRVIGKR